jgi:hypothetical protein
LPYPAGIGVVATAGTAPKGVDVRIEIGCPGTEGIYIIEMPKKTKPPKSIIPPVISGSIIKVTPGPITISFD